MHYSGEGVPGPDHEAALGWYRAAAENGIPDIEEILAAIEKGCPASNWRRR